MRQLNRREWLADVVMLALGAAMCATGGVSMAQEAKATMPTVMDASKFIDLKAPDCGLQKAIDSVPPGGVLAIPAGRYMLKRSLMLKSDMTFSGVGPETVLTILPEPPCSMLAEDAAKGATRIKVKDPNGFEAGMQVTVRSAVHDAWAETFAIIRTVKGDVLELDKPMRFPYTVADRGQTGNLFPAVMAEKQKNITLQFLTIVGPEKKPMFNRFVLDAIHLVRCDNVLITKCLVERWHSDAYGVQGGKNVLVMDNIARRCAGHGFHPGTSLQDSFWSGNLSEENGQFGLYYCWNNVHVIVSHNRFIKNAIYGVGRLGDGGDVDNLVYDNLFQENGAAGTHSGMFGDCRLNFIYDNKFVNNSTKQAGPAILFQMSRQTVAAKNEIIYTGDKPMQAAAIEEVGDGTNGNFIVENSVKGYKDSVLKRGRDTVVEDKFPGSIPPERVKLLEDLLARDKANWDAWQTRAKTIMPPMVKK